VAIAVGSERTERKFNIQLLVVGGAIAKLLNSAKLLLLFYHRRHR
jgi:acetylglutamate kinase